MLRHRERRRWGRERAAVRRGRRDVSGGAGRDGAPGGRRGEGRRGDGPGLPCPVALAWLRSIRDWLNVRGTGVCGNLVIMDFTDKKRNLNPPPSSKTPVRRCVSPLNFYIMHRYILHCHCAGCATYCVY